MERQRVLELLKTINKPLSAENIVDGNAIKRLDLDDNKINIEIEVAVAALNVRKKIENQVKYVLNKEFPNINVDAKINFVKTENNVGDQKSTTLSEVKHIIAIASGKGGVGKSTVTSNLAVALSNMGKKVAIVDADIYGPSIPTMFDVEKAKLVAKDVDGKSYMEPIEAHGIKMQSIGFFAPKGKAMAWRGAMATNALRQMIFDTYWGEIDYMLIDLPPGTGDVQLSLVQAVNLDGVVIVTTPQNVAVADAQRAVELFQNSQINVPILGLVENMSYFTPEELPDNKYYIFGKDGGKLMAEDLNLNFLGEIPIVQKICQASDAGRPICLSINTPMADVFAVMASKIVTQISEKNSTLI